MTMVKTLVALATERMLLKTSGPTFLRGIEFMYAAGLAPDRLSVMMTCSHKFVLQFHSKCDIRPFAANYPNFARVLRGIVHVRAWRIKSIEFVNVAFHMRDVENLERAIEKLGVELVLLRNCTYPGVSRGEEAVKFLSALNRKKQAVVCEYGDDRLKHRIARRTQQNRVRRPSRLLQDGALARLNADGERRADGDPLPPVGVALPAGQPIAPPPGLALPAPAAAAVAAAAGVAGGIPQPRPFNEPFDPQVVAMAIQLLNDQQAHLHELLQRGAAAGQAQNGGGVGGAGAQDNAAPAAANQQPRAANNPADPNAQRHLQMMHLPLYQVMQQPGGAAAILGRPIRFNQAAGAPNREVRYQNAQRAMAAAAARAVFNQQVHPNAPIPQNAAPEADPDSETDAENEEMELDEIPRENGAGRAGEDGPMNEDSEDDEDDNGGRVPVFEAVRADNEGGVGHDVLEQIMRDAAQADDIQNREIDAILDEEQDSPQAALLQ